MKNETGRRPARAPPPFVIRTIGKIHRGLYRASGGRLGRSFFGSPILLRAGTATFGIIEPKG